MKMKRLVAVVLLLAVGIMSFPVFAANKTLNFLETMTSPERTAVIKQMISKYESTHPGIKINLISPPYEQSDQKATVMLNTNQPLDILEVRDYTVKQFVNNKKLYNLKSNLAKWSGSKTLLPIVVQASKTVNNTPYLIPESLYIKGLFVRKDILETNGIKTIPQTMPELINTCIQITNPSKNQYGFAWRGKSAEIKFSDLIASSYVKDLKKNPYLYSEEKTFFTTPDYKKGMEAYVQLFQKGSPKDAINWGFNEQVNGFVSGTTPFLIQDPDAIGLIDKMLSPDKYEVVPVPVGSSGLTYLDYGFAGLGIPSYSKYKKEAWDFISWFSSAEQNGYYNEKYGPLPIHSTSFQTSSVFKGEHYKAFLYEMTHSDKYIFKSYPLSSPKYPGWQTVHEADMQSVLLGKMSMEDALTKWKNYWEK